MAELLKQRRESEEFTLLSKPFSDEMRDAFGKYVALFNQFDKLIASDMAFLPTKMRPAVLDGIKKNTKRLEKVQPQDRLDEILLGEMKRQLAIMKNEILLPQNKIFSYEAVLRSIGIGIEDINSEEKKFIRMNVEKTLEKWPEINGQSFVNKPNNEGETQQVKGAYIKLLEKSYRMVASMTVADFPTFNDYMHTKPPKPPAVNFNYDPKGRSYELSGSINLCVYNPNIIHTKREYRYIPILDWFSVAEIVGEEGLPGHQGQFLNTEHSSIPEFLKLTFTPATMVSVETLGRIGEMRMTQELGKNPDLVDGIEGKDFEFLRNRHDMSEKRTLIDRFMTGYQSYVYFKNKGDETCTAEAMRSLFRSPALASEEYKKEIKGYFGSTKFWSNYDEDIGMWGYVVAETMAERILKRLSALGKDKSKTILGHLQIGHWTKRGFEEYFEYLIENVSKNNIDLSETHRK